MERHEILEAMTERKLYGMRASFDAIAGKGLNRRDEISPLLASLLRAERTHRQARSISYRMSGARFPVLTSRFASLAGANETLARQSRRGETIGRRWDRVREVDQSEGLPHAPRDGRP